MMSSLLDWIRKNKDMPTDPRKRVCFLFYAGATLAYGMGKFAVQSMRRSLDALRLLGMTCGGVYPVVAAGWVLIPGRRGHDPALRVIYYKSES